MRCGAIKTWLGRGNRRPTAMTSVGLLLLALSPCVVQAQDPDIQHCKATLLAAYTTMEAVPAATGVTPATRGDYNDDGIQDVALLLQPKRRDRKQSIGVCLSNVAIPVLINYAYVPNRIGTKAKGTRYDDYDLGVTDTYERDAISVNDGVCCGASYVLRGGVFVEIVDSD